jgi:hypothetical protein
MYYARYTSCGDLYEASVFAVMSANPTFKDFKALKRFVKRIVKAGSTTVEFRRVPLQLYAYVDASHAIHSDGRGHGGVIITAGSAPVYSKSWKLKHVTLSSTDAEISALSECVTTIIWMRYLLYECGIISDKPTIVYQDNQSAMIMHQNGGGTFKRSKHLIVRKAFVKEYLDDNIIILEYLPTKDMLADILTKPLSGEQKRLILEKLFVFNYCIEDEKSLSKTIKMSK